MEQEKHLLPHSKENLLPFTIRAKKSNTMKSSLKAENTYQSYVKQTNFTSLVSEMLDLSFFALVLRGGGGGGWVVVVLENHDRKMLQQNLFAAWSEEKRFSLP